MTAAVLESFLPRKVQHIPLFDRYASLKENWQYSVERLTALRESLRGKLSENVETVAAAGSFGRFEGSTVSDADFILIVSDKDDPSVGSDRDVIIKAISDLNVSPPNKSGVFAQPRTVEELEETVGRPTEEFDVLGKRMLLLLESRPIYDDERFVEVLKRIFDRYAILPATDPSKEFVFLLNDLIRYFRYICVNYEDSFGRENEKWAVRNLKLRHSRLLMYAGLLFLIGEASKYGTRKKSEVIWESLGLTPLERLAHVYEKCGERCFFRVVGPYNVFLTKLSDPELRPRLNAIGYEERYSIPEFAELKWNSDSLSAELLRFVFARRGSWSERFFEYLLF
jgi:hypothetical protein